jgi:hypothetical protein
MNLVDVSESRKSFATRTKGELVILKKGETIRVFPGPIETTDSFHAVYIPKPTKTLLGELEFDFDNEKGIPTNIPVPRSDTGVMLNLYSPIIRFPLSRDFWELLFIYADDEQVIFEFV